MLWAMIMPVLLLVFASLLGNKASARNICQLKEISVRPSRLFPGCIGRLVQVNVCKLLEEDGVTAVVSPREENHTAIEMVCLARTQETPAYLDCFNGVEEILIATATACHAIPRTHANGTDFNASNNALSDIVLTDVPETQWQLSLYKYFQLVIVCVGLLGNAFSFLLMTSRKMRGFTFSAYLATLSLTDSLSLLHFGMDWMDDISKGRSGVFYFRVNSRMACLIYPLIVRGCFLSSAWLMVAFTLDRAFSVCFPFQAHRYLTHRHTYITIAVVVVASFLSQIYHPFLLKANVKYCGEVFAFPRTLAPDDMTTNDTLVVISRTGLLLTLPFLLILISNVAVVVTVKRRNKVLRLQNRKTNNSDFNSKKSPDRPMPSGNNTTARQRSDLGCTSDRRTDEDGQVLNYSSSYDVKTISRKCSGQLTYGCDAEYTKQSRNRTCCAWDTASGKSSNEITVLQKDTLNKCISNESASNESHNITSAKTECSLDFEAIAEWSRLSENRSQVNVTEQSLNGLGGNDIGQDNTIEQSLNGLGGNDIGQDITVEQSLHGLGGNIIGQDNTIEQSLHGLGGNIIGQDITVEQSLHGLGGNIIGQGNTIEQFKSGVGSTCPDNAIGHAIIRPGTECPVNIGPSTDSTGANAKTTSTRQTSNLSFSKLNKETAMSLKLLSVSVTFFLLNLPDLVVLLLDLRLILLRVNDWFLTGDAYRGIPKMLFTCNFAINFLLYSFAFRKQMPSILCKRRIPKSYNVNQHVLAKPNAVGTAVRRVP